VVSKGNLIVAKSKAYGAHGSRAALMLLCFRETGVDLFSSIRKVHKWIIPGSSSSSGDIWKANAHVWQEAMHA
jgi:hypothetical protein